MADKVGNSPAQNVIALFLLVGDVRGASRDAGLVARRQEIDWHGCAARDVRGRGERGRVSSDAVRWRVRSGHGSETKQGVFDFTSCEKLVGWMMSNTISIVPQRTFILYSFASDAASFCASERMKLSRRSRHAELPRHRDAAHDASSSYLSLDPITRIGRGIFGSLRFSGMFLVYMCPEYISLIK